MYDNNDRDITKTLFTMAERAIDEARYDQAAAQQKLAGWVAQDRRFDKYNPHVVAREVFDAKNHGRQMRLDSPVQTNHTGAGPGWTSRSV